MVSKIRKLYTDFFLILVTGILHRKRKLVEVTQITKTILLFLTALTKKRPDKHTSTRFGRQ